MLCSRGHPRQAGQSLNGHRLHAVGLLDFALDNEQFLPAQQVVEHLVLAGEQHRLKQAALVLEGEELHRLALAGLDGLGGEADARQRDGAAHVAGDVPGRLHAPAQQRLEGGQGMARQRVAERLHLHLVDLQLRQLPQVNCCCLRCSAPAEH